MKLELIFKLLAVILVGVAAFFLWQKNWEGVFAAAVLGICAFFLSMRFQLKARLDKRKAEEEAQEYIEEEQAGEDSPE